MTTTTRLMRVFIAALTAGVAACQMDRPTGVSPADTEQNIQRPKDASGALDPSGNCLDCRVGPVTFVRETGAPRVVTRTFAATAGQTFVVDLDDLGSRGADAVVTLNGVTLLPNRGSGDDSPRHYREMVTVAALNTLEIRLLGKPGSMLRVAIWLYRPVTIDAITLPENTHLQIDVSAVSFEATVTNHTPNSLTGLFFFNTVRQGNTERASGTYQLAGCGAPPGTLPPGSCVVRLWMFAGNWTWGQGTLVPGPAMGFITLRDGAGTLAAKWVSLVLEPELKIPASVQLTPTTTIAAGQQVQLTAIHSRG
jgi:hypothetical protein